VLAAVMREEYGKMRQSLYKIVHIHPFVLQDDWWIRLIGVAE
jgi:hypothetical protein